MFSTYTRYEQRAPLGGDITFHSQVRQAGDIHDTSRKVRDLRKTLLMRHGPDGVEKGTNRQSIRVEKNAIEVNNANKATLFRGVPNRVRSAAFLSLGKRTKSKLHSINATKCHRWQTGSQLAHSCDVLGPYACADCLKERMRKQIYDEAERTFPGLEVSERDLCTSSHLNDSVTRMPEGTSKLPPIMESGYIDPDTSRGRNTARRTPSTRSGSYRRLSYGRKVQPLQKRSAGSLQTPQTSKLLPITNTELQRRVLRKKLSGDTSTTSANQLLHPTGIIEEITEPALAPSIRTKIDVQVPVVSTFSREASNLSSVK